MQKPKQEVLNTLDKWMEGHKRLHPGMYDLIEPMEAATAHECVGALLAAYDISDLERIVREVQDYLDWEKGGGQEALLS